MTGRLILYWDDEHSEVIKLYQRLKGISHNNKRPSRCSIEITSDKLDSVEVLNLATWLSEVSQVINNW